MKRVLSALLAICLTLCAALPAGALTAADFTDVPDNWARPAIAYCLEKGLMSGVGNGKFNPGGRVAGHRSPRCSITGKTAPAWTAWPIPLRMLAPSGLPMLWCGAKQTGL